MGWYAHHCAVAIGDEYVVADPDIHCLTRQRMGDGEPGGHAFLFHRGHVGLDHTALLAFGNEGGERGIGLCGEGCQRMFGSDCTKGHAHDGIGAGGEDPHLAVIDQLATGITDLMREGEAYARGFAYPVRLHDAHAFWPAWQLVFNVIEQLFSVIGDARVIHWNFALLDHSTGAPATTIDDLFVGEHSLIDGIPVYGAGFFIDDAFFQHLQEHPLVPSVVIRAARSHFARPIDCQTHGLHLGLHVVDVRVRPLRGRHVVGHCRIFGRHTEGVPAHGHQDVATLHAQLTCHDVVDCVIAHMAHMEFARRVGQH